MTLPVPAFQLPAAAQPAPAPTPAAPAPAAPAPAAPVIPMDYMAQKYRQLRDRKEAIEATHKEQLKPFRDAMDQLEGLMQKQLNDSGMTSARTEHGTIISSTRRSITVADPEAFRVWRESYHGPDLLEGRVSKEAVEAYVAAGNQLPDGLKVSSVTTIQVRKN